MVAARTSPALIVFMHSGWRSPRAQKLIQFWVAHQQSWHALEMMLMFWSYAKYVELVGPNSTTDVVPTARAIRTIPDSPSMWRIDFLRIHGASAISVLSTRSTSIPEMGWLFPAPSCTTRRSGDSRFSSAMNEFQCWIGQHFVAVDDIVEY